MMSPEQLPIYFFLQKGVIEPVLFSMLVLMAIVTTLIASPLFELVYGRQAPASSELGAVPIGKLGGYLSAASFLRSIIFIQV